VGAGWWFRGQCGGYALQGDATKAKAAIRISSRSGKMPTLTFPSPSLRKPSTRSLIN